MSKLKMTDIYDCTVSDDKLDKKPLDLKLYLSVTIKKQ